MKIVSFNINSIRARLHQLESLISIHQPDVIGLQETKVQDDLFPVEAVKELGYHVYFHGQKAHYGVAMLSKQPPAAVIKGYPSDDENDQRRMITADFSLANGETLRVLNGYFPQGESRDHPVKFPAKMKFYRDLIAFIKSCCSEHKYLAVIGDYNIAPLDHDIGIGDANAKRWLREGKTSFLPEERGWIDQLTDMGLYDTYREKHPNISDRFSWFDYRSKGFEREPKRGLRIDHIYTNAALTAHLDDSDIDYEIRSMSKPSDHCPVWSTFSLELK